MALELDTGTTAPAGGAVVDAVLSPAER
jgi:hypothetical protein